MNGKGISFSGALVLILITLQLLGYIDWFRPLALYLLWVAICAFYSTPVIVLMFIISTLLELDK